MSDTKRGEMTVREAAKLGWKKQVERIGTEGLSEMGKKGGGATMARHGLEHYRRIGALGAQARARNRAEKEGAP